MTDIKESLTEEVKDIQEDIIESTKKNVENQEDILEDKTKKLNETETKIDEYNKVIDELERTNQTNTTGNSFISVLQI